MNWTKRLHARNERQNPAALMAITLVIMYVISGVMLFLLAFLLYKFDLSESVVRIGIVAVYIASGFFGGFVLGKRIQDKKYLWGLTVGAAYFALLFLLSFLFKQGMGMDMAAEPVKVLTTLVLCAVSGMAGGMFS